MFPFHLVDFPSPGFQDIYITFKGHSSKTTHLLPLNWPNQAHVMFSIILYRLDFDSNKMRRSNRSFHEDVVGSVRSESSASAICSVTSGCSSSPLAWYVAKKALASS